MAVNEIYQAIINQRLHGQVILNVLHYRQTVAPTMGTDEASLAGGVVANVVPAFKSFQSSELTHDGVTVQKIFPLPPLLAYVDPSSAGPGSIAGSSLPTSVNAVITKQTQYAGRKYRGRVYVSGIPITYEDDSKLSVAGEIALQVVADALEILPGTNGGSFTPILWHRSTKTFDPLLRCIERSVLRNQRRRQVGRGA